MAVTLGVYGATDATGWTTVTPSEPSGEGSGFSGAGTRKIYVDSSAANDSGDGSQASPKKTIVAGRNLMRSAKPDHLYLKKGGVWTDESFGFLGNVGTSSSEPAMISAYGSGARPLVPTMAGTSSGTILAAQAADTNANYLAMIGLEFYAYKADPDNPSYDPLFTGTVSGFRAINAPRWWLIEDCKTSFVAANTFDTSSASINAGTFIMRRNVFHNHYSNNGVHAQGWYIEGIDNLTIEENVFDHNGWNDTVGSGKDIFKHNLYLGADIPGRIRPATVRGNTFARGCSHGVQQRIGGTCYDNLFLNNSIAAFVSENVSEMSWNVVLQGADITGALPRGQGLEILVSNSLCKKNIVAHQESANPSANAFALKINANDCTFTDNVAYDWASAASGVIDDNGTGTISSNNVIDGTGYPDPARSVSSYNATQGFTASLSAFMTECRKQSKDNWRTAYTANAVNNYIRAGFNMPAIIGTEPETAETSSVGSRIVAHSSHSFSRRRFDALMAAIRAAEERAADLSVKAGKRQLRAAAAAAKQASKENITAREAHALAQSLKAAASAKALADRLDDAKKAVNQAYAILGQQDEEAMAAFLLMN